MPGARRGDDHPAYALGRWETGRSAGRGQDAQALPLQHAGEGIEPQAVVLYRPTVSYHRV